MDVTPDIYEDKGSGAVVVVWFLPKTRYEKVIQGLDALVNDGRSKTKPSFGCTRISCKGVSEVYLKTPVSMETIAHEVYHAARHWLDDEEQGATAAGGFTAALIKLAKSRGVLKEN